MKISLKNITLVLFLSLILTSSGCRTKGTSTTTQPKETSNPIKKELVIWNLFDNSDALKGQIQAFESLNPGVQITYKKFVNAEEYWNTILNELAEGEGPDILAVNNNWINKNYKKFYPMPEGNLSIPMNPEIFRQTFFNVASEDLIIDNKIIGIPLSIDTLALYYNKQLFIDNISNSDEPAKTWDGIKEQVYTITKQDKSPERFFVSGIALGRSDNILRSSDLFYLMLLQHGTQIYDDTKRKSILSKQQGIVEGTGKPYYPGLSALELYTSFAIPSYKNYAWNEFITGQSPNDKEINPFIRGKVGMIFGYSFLYDQLADAIQGQVKTGGQHINLADIGIAPIPQLYNFQETGKQDAYANYFPLVVSRNTEYPEEAWNFLLYISSQDSLQTYHEKTHKPTSRKDMVDAQSTEPLWGVFARQASYAKSLQIYDLDKFNQYLAESIDSVVQNKKTLKDALQLAETKINCLLDKVQNNTNQDIDCDILL